MLLELATNFDYACGIWVCGPMYLLRFEALALMILSVLVIHALLFAWGIITTQHQTTQ